jgi:hypothetical protein
MSSGICYYVVDSVQDALQTLDTLPVPPDLSPGNRFIFDLQQGRMAPVDTLVDVTVSLS